MEDIAALRMVGDTYFHPCYQVPARSSLSVVALSFVLSWFVGVSSCLCSHVVA